MINSIAQKQIDYIAERCKKIKPLVVIQCITYNQEPYLKDALEGFVMQKTEFPFIAIVHEDASTDKTAEILREYADKYPDIIFPIIEKENQYSKRNGSLKRVMKTAREITGAKYIALCEGDDYWIDPFKLQKQVNFLELHPDYSMCCTNFYNEYSDKSRKLSKYHTLKSKDLKIEDIIINGGLYISTASICYRYQLAKNLPYEDKNLTIGDHPLQIYLAYIGKIKLLEDITTIYRINSSSSWSLKNKEHKHEEIYRKKLLNDKIHLANVMNEITNFEYDKVFKDWIILRTFGYLLHFNSINLFKIVFKNPLLIKRHYGLKSIIYGLLPASVKNYLEQKNYITK